MAWGLGAAKAGPASRQHPAMMLPVGNLRALKGNADAIVSVMIMFLAIYAQETGVHWPPVVVVTAGVLAFYHLRPTRDPYWCVGRASSGVGAGGCGRGGVGALAWRAGYGADGEDVATTGVTPSGGGMRIMAPVMGMKNTPTSRREWTLPLASLV